ncbi:hypothetical protein [Caldimonas manganoxidans]|uniref:hypothetical protein n=1 Tax=Caldimonas manganoxidans TaxID=196015 RepID=UPI00036F340D|nr:hypothetical protein [Caldimonas manganoxidans]
MKPIEAEYACYLCETRETITVTPSSDDINRRRTPAAPRKLCPRCGAFMLPAHLLRRMRMLYPPEGRMSEEDERALFRQFASCKHAYDCNGLDNYSPECEQGRVMPKCLDFLRHQLQDANDKLDRLVRALLRPTALPDHDPDQTPPR